MSSLKLRVLLTSLAFLTSLSLAQSPANILPEDGSTVYTKSPELQIKLDEDPHGELNLSFRGGKTIGTKSQPAVSCKQIHDLRPSLDSRKYWLDPEQDGGEFQAYCNMQRKGGGWTLLMNLNQTKGKFSYSSNYWTNNETYNNDLKLPNNGTDDFSAKYSAFSSVQGDSLMVTFTDPDHQIRYRDFSSMTAQEIFNSGQNWVRYNDGECTSLHDNYIDYNSNLMRFGRGGGGFGVNIDDNRNYGPINARLIIGQDEDTTHSVLGQSIAIGTDQGSIYWNSDGGDGGDCGYYGNGYTPEDGTTTGSLWIREEKTYTGENIDTVIESRDISSSGTFSTEWQDLENQREYYWYATIENSTYSRETEAWSFVVQSICDSRGSENQCIVDETHSVAGTFIEIESILDFRSSSEIESGSEKSILKTSNRTLISGVFTGHLRLESEKPVIRPGTKLKPNDERITVAKER